MRHNLKIIPSYYEAVVEGSKTFEVRDNSDRGFQKGDIVTLREHDQEQLFSKYTGKKITVEITYVTNWKQKEDHVVFGFKVID